MVSKNRSNDYDKGRAMAIPLIPKKRSSVLVRQKLTPLPTAAHGKNTTNMARPVSATATERPTTMKITLRGKTLGRVTIIVNNNKCVVQSQSITKKEPLPSNTSPAFKGETGNLARDKFQEIMVEALSKVAGEVGQEFREAVLACHPVHVALDVESLLFEKLGPFNGAHKLKYRSIIFNMRDPTNPDFRRKVLLGKIKPEKLVSMSTEEMASTQRRKQNKDIRAKALSKKIVKGEDYTAPLTE